MHAGTGHLLLWVLRVLPVVLWAGDAAWGNAGVARHLLRVVAEG
jgi:hypothetical protein